MGIRDQRWESSTQGSRMGYVFSVQEGGSGTFLRAPLHGIVPAGLVDLPLGHPANRVRQKGARPRPAKHVRGQAPRLVKNDLNPACLAKLAERSRKPTPTTLPPAIPSWAHPAGIPHVGRRRSRPASS